MNMLSQFWNTLQSLKQFKEIKIKQKSEKSNIIQNINVKVRRQDTTKEDDVRMVDEFKRFLNFNEPEFRNSYSQFPKEFTYKARIHGFLEIAKEMTGQVVDSDFNNWKTNIHGQEGEEKVLEIIEKVFRLRTPSLVIVGFECKNLLKIKKTEIKTNIGTNFGLPIQEEEEKLCDVMDVNLNKIKSLTKSVVLELMEGKECIEPSVLFSHVDKLKESDLFKSFSMEAIKEFNFIFGEKGLRKKFDKVPTIFRTGLENFLTRHIMTSRWNKNKSWKY